MCSTGMDYILKPKDNIQINLFTETENVVCKKPHTGSVYSNMEMFNWSKRSACAALGCWQKRRWPL